MRRLHKLGSLGVCLGKNRAGDYNKGLQEMPVWQQELRRSKDDLRLHRRYGTQKAMQTGRLPGSRSLQAQGECEKETVKSIKEGTCCSNYIRYRR